MDAQKYLIERIDNQLGWYDSKSKYNKKMFYLLTTIQMVIAALLPLYALIEAENFLNLKDVLISATGVAIVITSGLVNNGKFREKWVNYRKTVEGVNREKYKYLTQAGPYDGDEVANFKLFVQTVESMYSEEISDWEKSVQAIKVPDPKQDNG